MIHNQEADLRCVFNEMGRFESIMLDYIQTHILRNGKTLSDIFPHAYESLETEIQESGVLLGIFVLQYIIHAEDFYRENLLPVSDYVENIRLEIQNSQLMN